MTDPIDPIGKSDRVSRVRRAAAAAARAGGAASPSQAVVPAAPVRTHDPEPARFPGDAAFAAQLLGGGPRRGLKGGPETLEQARSTYLTNEYSGPADRRRKKGRAAKTDV